MPGIYVHIPFCRQACHYCNFHFSTSLKNKSDLLSSIHAEIDLRSNFLPERHLDSIYFGGGTPSILETSSIENILIKLSDHFDWTEKTEITLEANPEDLDPIKCAELKKIGINRLSLGIQSFNNEELKSMNRVHNAEQGEKAISNILEEGFSSFSVDLMFGLLGSDLVSWKNNLSIVRKYCIPHLSCYNLTIEEQTVYHNWVSKKKIVLPDEGSQTAQFELASEFLTDAGYDHYEISNYAMPGHYAGHNTSYWKMEPYLGIGPSAHSYDGLNRSWNLANNASYIRAFKENKSFSRLEVLTEIDMYNEMIMLGLRTKWGISKTGLQKYTPGLADYFFREIEKFILRGTIIENGGSYVLAREKRYLSDTISSDLFYTE